VARGTQHRKRRTGANARTAAVAAPPRRAKTPQWQEQLFFQRLRLHAKWAYVLLAVAFAATFALLGVGSGSTGISDAFQNLFSNNGGSGTSISSLQHKVAKHPLNANAWRDLATAYEQKQRTQDAVNALERYSALRPKDQGALAELAAQYTTLAQTYASDYTSAQSVAALQSSPGSVFAPPATSPFGKAFNDPAALKDPIANAVQTVTSTKTSTAYAQYQTAQRNAESAYKKVAKLNPDDATTQIQLGQTAQAAGDTKTAIAAYKRFLKLAPTDPYAGQIKQQLKSLQKPAVTSNVTGG
jgi:cytochrome c-type biogenesis protein CcmH/NrfG